MPTNLRRNVESGVKTVDAHERSRDFITEDELQRLIKAAARARHRYRDAAIMVLMFRHGLRVSELCDLKVKDVDMKQARLWINRKKGSLSTEQPIHTDAYKALKKYFKNERQQSRLPWLFLSERQQRLDRSTVNYLVREAGKRAALPFHIHPHMFRHGCGYALANKGIESRIIQDYLGHRDPKMTARYTRTAASQFEDLWG